MTVMTVRVDIGAVLKDGFATAFATAGIAATKLDGIIQTVDTRIATMKGWAAAKKETAAAKEEWQRATTKAKALGDQLAATANPTEDLKNKVAAARKEADQAKAAFMGTATGLKAMDVQLKAAGVSIKTVKVELDTAEKSMAALTHRREALNKAMAAKVANTESRTALKGQIIETVALGAALAAPINQAIKFESAMSDVKKAVTFSDPIKGLQAMEGAIKDMARVIPIAHEGLAAIVTAGGKAGVAEKDLRTYTETVARMSTAFEMAPDAVGTAMGKIGNVLHLAVGDLELVGDAINTVADAGNSNESEILNVMQRISGTGVSAHMSAQQLVALSGAFIDLGAAPEVAATGINSMMNKLLAAPVGTKKFKEGLQEIGWAAEDMQQSMLKDAQGTLVNFLDSLQGLDEAKRMNLMADMFGAEYSDDMNRLIGGLDIYKKHLKTVGDQANYAGSMMAGFKEKSQTTAAQIQIMNNRLNEGAIGGGGTLLPAVKDVVKAIGATASAINDLSAQFPLVTKGIVYTTAALIAYKVAKLAIGFAWTSVKGVMLDTRIAFVKTATAATIATAKVRGFSLASTVTGFRAAGAAMLAFAGRPVAAVLGGLKAIRIATLLNPIGLLVNGLIMAVPLIIENWDKIWKVVKPAIDLVSGAFQAIPVVSDAIKWAMGGDDKKPAAKDGTDGMNGADLPTAINDNASNDNGADSFESPKVARGGSGPVYHIGQITIQVQAQPGQDPAAIASAVKKSFQGAASGGELYDK
ncbi:MAG: phage tail tape measure protein [Magnetospirillum sp.]|nr:phage tail tape measure protein [Magnetospirillum sp.]